MARCHRNVREIGFVKSVTLHRDDRVPLRQLRGDERNGMRGIVTEFLRF